MTSDERTARITLDGDLGIYNRAHVESLLPDVESIDRLILDCTNATSVDSSVLTLLMRYRRRFVEKGGDPFEIVIIASPSVRRMFEVAGLSRLLTVINSNPEQS